MLQKQTGYRWWRFFLHFIFAIPFVLLLFFGIFYLAAPYFEISETRPFSGIFFYNPYQNLDSENQLKLEIQSKSANFWDMIRNRHYQIRLKGADSLTHDNALLNTSNFHVFQPYVDHKGQRLRIYRHGYGTTSGQQLCIGARKIIWTDYPFFGQLRHKQNILNKLNRSSELVALSKPDQFFTTDELIQLIGYQLIELSNTSATSMACWDTVLSHGQAVHLLLGNFAENQEDETLHSVFSTRLLIDELNVSNLLESLKKGSFYNLERPFSALTEEVPQLISADILADTFQIEVWPAAVEIKLIGQNGQVLHRADHTPQTAYPLSGFDTYIRAEISFDDGTILYLNPIVRSGSAALPVRPTPKFDVIRTSVMRSLYIIATVLILSVLISTTGKKKPQ